MTPQFYVTELKTKDPEPGALRPWKYFEASKLFCMPGDVEALHQFAEAMGLRRQWFKDDDLLPHYELTKWMRDKALLLGAEAACRASLDCFELAWTGVEREHPGYTRVEILEAHAGDLTELYEL